MLDGWTGGGSDNNDLFKVISDGSDRSGTISLGVVPVVTLKSNIKLKATSEFYTETATATTATNEETEFVHTLWAFE